MNKYNSKVREIIKSIIFNMLSFSLCFVIAFALLFCIGNIELWGAITFSIIISIFATIIIDLFKLLLTEVD